MWDKLPHWEQTSEKKFDRAVRNHKATCTSKLGTGRYHTYYDEDSNPVARIDSELNVFEILIK